VATIDSQELTDFSRQIAQSIRQAGLHLTRQKTVAHRNAKNQKKNANNGNGYRTPFHA
jgi:hypothetical protein